MSALWYPAPRPTEERLFRRVDAGIGIGFEDENLSAAHGETKRGREAGNRSADDCDAPTTKIDRDIA